MKKYFNDAAGREGSSAPPSTNPAPAKSTAWISYLLAVLVFGGVGFYIYQGMNKNKTASAVTTDVVTAPDTTSTVTTTTVTPTETDTTVTNTVPPPTTIGPTTTTTPTTTATDPEAKKKADAAKKAKLAADAKKKEEEKKKEQAAKEARERDMRNNWQRYVTVGALNFMKDNDDGIREFAIPVSNGTSAALDKVTLRVDYLKKEGKIAKTETLTLYNIPARGTQSIMAPANKKAKKANVYITEIMSRGLHFCYPRSGGNPTDPYYCIQ